MHSAVVKSRFFLGGVLLLRRFAIFFLFHLIIFVEYGLSFYFMMMLFGIFKIFNLYVKEMYFFYHSFCDNL